MAVKKGAVRSLGLVLALLGLSASCVSSRHYDECMADNAALRERSETARRTASTRIQDIQQRLVQAQGALQDRDARLSDLSTTLHNRQAQIDEATAINQQLRDELQRLGKDVDKVLAERGSLSKALDDAKVRLEELRQAQAAGEVRAQLFRGFAQRFRPLEEAGQVRVVTRRGELVLEVDGELLFDEGRTELRSAGKGALMEIARALETTSPASTGRRFLVTADVDAAESGPSKRFRSSWEVTVARAVAVVEYLVSLGVPATSLTAAGAGSFDPLLPGDDAARRPNNRRVEIALFSSSVGK